MPLRNRMLGIFAAVTLALAGCSIAAPARVLAEGEDWQLVVARGPALEFREGDSTSGVSDYTRPVTLNEAHSFFPQDGNTVVAGPVAEEAQEVVVTTAEAGRASAELAVTHGFKWFWVVLPGEQAVSDIVAHNGSGAVVDEYTLPPMPGPPPPSG